MTERLRDAKGRFLANNPPITAAASVIPTATIDRMPRSAQGWQERAWRLWRELGVLHYPTSFMAEQVARVDWDVEINGQQLEPDQAAKAVAAVTGTLGAGEASRRLALNLEVAGEVFYARAADDWHVWAATVPKRQEKLASADIVVRSILSDPVNPDDPDSPVRAALDVAEEVRVIQALSRAQTRSRVGQRGILLVPKEGRFPEDDDFGANLEEHLTAPINDEFHPSAAAPLKVEFPAEYIEHWRHLVLESPYDDKLQERLDNAIKRLALSLNIPPEVLLGNIDSSHWNAWLSEESTYRAHVGPLATMVGEVFAEAMMQAVDRAATIVVTPDPSELLARRSSVADALEGAKLGAVGLAYVRKVMGADEDDKPTPEDLIIIQAMTRRADSNEIVTPESGQPVRKSPDVPAETPSPNGDRPVTASLPDGEAALDRLAQQLSDLDQHMRGRLHAAAEMASDMVLDSLTDPDMVGLDEQVAERMQRLGTMWSREVDSGRRALTDLGIDASGQEWDTAQATSVDMLRDGMTAWTITQVGKEPSERAAVPGDLLREVLAAAGGTGTAVVAALLPPPTTQDALGFAVGVLSSKDLARQGVRFTQWRFRYGTLHREDPFVEHKDQDGRFATKEGTVDGWYPGDHTGCLCGLTPVLRPVSVPEEVR